MMRCSLRGVLLVLFSTSISIAQTSESVRPQVLKFLQEGTAAYDKGDIQAASRSFLSALGLDPTMASVAAVEVAQGDPGIRQGYRLKYWDALSKTASGLAQGKSLVPEMGGLLAGSYFYTMQFQKAREEYLRLAASLPRDASPLYAAGAAAFHAVVYGDWANCRFTQPSAINAMALVDSGLADLDKALTMDSGHSYAMAYKQKLLQEKSRRTTDAAQKVVLQSQAEEWINRAAKARSAAQPANPGSPMPPVPPIPGFPVPTVDFVVGGVRGGAGAGGAAFPPVPAATNCAPAFPPFPPPPPPAPPPGSTSTSSKLLYSPQPVFPPLAKTARVSATVRAQVTIDTEGKASEIKILEGHPLLDNAVVDAIKQWRWTPPAVPITVMYSFNYGSQPPR